VGRLHCIIILTSDLSRQREFYEKRLGLDTAHVSDDWVGYAMRGSALALHAKQDGAPELQVALIATPLEARMTALKAKGVKFEDGIVDAPTCRMAVLSDPEGNRVQLVEPTKPLAEGRWPRLSHAIINAAKFEATVQFYRETLGLKVANEKERWVEFDTGETKLAIHDRDDAVSLALHPDQRITFALEDDDFEVWAEELRERGVKFAATPAEESLGVQAEVEDADGWFVVLHGPAPEEPIEEALASEYEEDDDAPTRAQVRRAGEMGGGDAAKKAAYNPAKTARKQAAKSGTKSYDALQKGKDADRGGYQPPTRPSYSTAPRPGGFSSPRPGGFSSPRPGGFSSPRPAGPRPDGPRSDAPRPSAPRSDAPRPSGPRSDSPRPSAPRSDAPRRPAGPPRPDRGGRE